MVAERDLQRLGLACVVQLRRRAVGVDVVDVLRLEPRVLDRQRDRARRRLAGLVGCHLVERVVGRRVADQLTVDAGAALIGVLQRLEDQRARALAGDETIAVAVERPARLLGRFVARREGADGVEGRDPYLAQRRLGAAREHDVRVAALDHPRRVAERLRRRRARSRHGRVRAAEVELHRHRRARHVGDDRRRVHRVQPTLGREGDRARRHVVERADAGAHRHADAEAVLLGEVQA